MKRTAAKIHALRNEQLTRGMRAAAILGFFAVLCSLTRAYVIGWHNAMYAHTALYLATLGVAFWSHRFSFFFKASMVLGLALLLGIVGLSAWGLASFGLLALFSFCILATIFFGTRAGIAGIITSLMTIGTIGMCARFGVITFSLNTESYLASPMAWLGAFFAMSLSAGIIGVVLGTLNSQMDGLVLNLENQNDELLKKNMLLENEIAERKREEEARIQLEAKLQLARKMESIGQLAGGVAHDLNNTLGSIVGYPDLLLMDIPADSPLRDPLETIKKTGIKAAAIVNDLLTIARNGIATPEVLNLNLVVSDYLKSPEFAQLRSYHPKAEIETNLGQIPLAVRGSFFHLTKVLMNIVSNATEAMPDGGMINVSTEMRKIHHPIPCVQGEIKAGDYAVLTVTDTGMGIPNSDIERIFEPFFTKKSMGRSGTGLGMAVVWGSVKDHNGHIIVESSEGFGTKIAVYIPITREQPCLKLVKPRTTPLGNGESILVVDDVREQSEMASRILSKLGYSVHTVRSGEEAIEYLDHASADLLILDMLMNPGIDGLETYRRVLEMHPDQKALMVTGFSETSQISETRALGAGGFIKKPYQLDQLAIAVRAELDRRVKRRGGIPGRLN
jgi:signal transduction histidine kinase/ActR/RegA family two-component response regulator